MIVARHYLLFLILEGRHDYSKALSSVLIPEGCHDCNNQLTNDFSPGGVT
jgi:hypothetical protein